MSDEIIRDFWGSDYKIKRWAPVRSLKIDLADVMSPFVTDRLEVRSSVVSDKKLSISFQDGTLYGAPPVYFEKGRGLIHLTSEPKPAKGIEALQTLYGLALHAAGHAKLSNSIQIKKEGEKAIFDFLEDSRVENIMTNEYPGIASYFKHSNDAYVKEPMVYEVLKQAAFYARHGRRPEKMIPFLDKVFPLIREARVSKNSQGVAEIARKVYDLLRMESPDIDTQARSMPQAYKHEFSSWNSEGENCDYEGEIKDLIEGDGQQQNQRKPEDEQLKEMVSQGDEESKKALKGYKPKDVEADKDFSRKPFFSKYEVKEPVFKNEETFMKYLNKAIANRLASEFLELQVIPEDRETRKRGRLKSSRIWRNAVYGDERIFHTKTTDNNHLNVLLMVDESGSMQDNNKSRLARGVAITLHEALRKSNIEHCIVGYTADPRDGENDRNMQGMVSHTLYKKFGDKKRSLRLAGIEAKFENRDGPSIRLANTYFPTSGRNLMIVTSDGAPFAAAYSGSMALKDTAKAITEVKDSGTAVVGIGIQCKHGILPTIYDSYVSINREMGALNALGRVIRRELDAL